MQMAVWEQELLTVRQVAALFHVGEKAVRDRILSGRLPAQKLDGGKQWLIRREDALRAVGGESPSGAGIVRAGEDVLGQAAGAGVVRRTGTAAGRARALAMLRGLREGDAPEQGAAWDALRQFLDEDRLSDRALFPTAGGPEREGAS